MFAFDTRLPQPLVVPCETLQEALTRADQARRQLALLQAELAHYEAQAVALQALQARNLPVQRPVNQR
ncbi:MAG: hypothetical protein RLZZ182_2117 [Pseudomonadota bacterium]